MRPCLGWDRSLDPGKCQKEACTSKILDPLGLQVHNTFFHSPSSLLPTTAPTQLKEKFFREAAHSFGRTALLLSGGASLGMYHLGEGRGAAKPTAAVGPFALLWIRSNLLVEEFLLCVSVALDLRTATI